MEILYLDLKPIGNGYAQLSYFWDNSNEYQSRLLSLTEIATLIERSETDYYTRLPEDYAKTGQALYNWLDGSEHLLENALNRARRAGIVLAIVASEGLASLPWEILHDGKSFLVERRPAIIPVRWVKGGSENKLTLKNDPKNRELNVLFMATSPIGIEPELDFEAEEGRILEATRLIPLSLTVEESGCLTELGYLVKSYEHGYFDIIHLIGRTTFQEGKPRFITETECGEPEYSSAEDIARALNFRLPDLIFLSGSRTGYSWDLMPSMAEELLNLGATAVLGWGQSVKDREAVAATATLYQELAAGNTLVESLALTYQNLLRIQGSHWHSLRLFVTGTLPGALVTRLRTRDRKRLPPPTTLEFRDEEGRLRVASRKDFVGRRRELENCLRVLKTFTEKVGVLIYGMGGLGKSSIAARLCDRLWEHEPIVWWRQIDESSLVNKLTDRLSKPEQRTALKEGKEELKYRLQYVFSELHQQGSKPFLLVFDDFEWNLEPRDGSYILKSSVASVLRDLVWAINNQDNISYHRIIITCRYDFQSDLSRNFYKQPLRGLSKSDLQKYLRHQNNFNSRKVDATLVNRALLLADGNPRLLEFINDEVLSGEDRDSKLSQIEDSSEDWKTRIIWPEELYKMKVFADTWNTVNSALDQHNMEAFRNNTDELTRLFCQSVAFKTLSDSDTLDQLYGRMIDASNPAFQVNIPPKFPLIYACKTAFSEEDARKISGLLHRFGINTDFFALLVVFSNHQQIRQQIRESPYKNDYIVLNYDQLWDILAAKSPIQQLTNCILEQIDLVAISPYKVSGAVQGKMFFGRAKEEKTLIQNIARNDYAILANRKTGKTSLLNRISLRLESIQNYQVFYCDLQTVTNYARFYKELALSYQEFDEEISNFSDLSPLSFRQLISTIKQRNSNRQIIFIFDEVDGILAYDIQEEEQLFKTFRSLSQRDNIRFIFSGTTTLVKRVRHPDSPLFNFCSPIKIGILEENAARDLVRVPMMGTLGVTFENESAIVQRILDLTAQHPNIIQYICDALIRKINEKQERTITEQDLDMVVTSQEFYDYFEDLIWGQYTALEKLIVYTMWSYPEFTESEVIEEFKRREIPSDGVKASLEIRLTYSTLSKKNNKYFFTFREFAKLMEQRSDIPTLAEQYTEQYKREIRGSEA